MTSQRKRAPSRPGPPRPVGSVGKALAVLRAFVDGQEQWGVRELAAAIGQPSSTVHRLLSKLRQDGFLEYDSNRQRYRIGFEFFRLAAVVSQRQGVRQVALPILAELAERLGESVWLALHDAERHRIAFAAEHETRQPLRYAAPIGREESLIDGACGLVVLAGLPVEEQRRVMATLKGQGLAVDTALVEKRLASIRDVGYAVVQAPEVEAAVTVAAAITDARHRPTASLCAVVPLHRYDPARERWLGTQVRDAALRVSYLMGARLLGGASVGSWHDAIAVIAELLRRREPGLIVTPALGRGRRNLEDLAAGLGAYGLATAASLHDAYRGRPPYDRPLGNLRAIMNLSPLHLHIMLRPGLEVASVGDLYGLRISPGEQDSSGGDAFSDLMRCAQAETKRRRRRGEIAHMDYPEARRQFLAGGLDALAWLTAVRNPLVRELESNLDARLIGVDDALLDRMLALNPGYRRGVIPAATYPRLMSGDVSTLMVPTVLVCSADRPADEVHEVTRTVFEHRAELALIASVYRRLDASFALDGLTAPLHPGAQRYWQGARQKAAKVAAGT